MDKKVFYFKEAKDIFIETLNKLNENDRLLEQQKNISSCIKNGNKRKKCVVCNNSLESKTNEIFIHREVSYKICNNCGHLQTEKLPPPDYSSKGDWNQIYPTLSEDDYISRMKRIYKPKLDWFLNQEFIDSSRIKNKKWTDIGSGCGYFLYSLKNSGFSNIEGFESSEPLVNVSDSFVGSGITKQSTSLISILIKTTDSDIYSSFFVFEHVSDTFNIAKELSKKKPGTILYFSVPVFSLGMIMESSFNNQWARVLDSVLHTQLYTDKSINKFLEISGFEPMSEWVFGSDSCDFMRSILLSLRYKYPKSLYQEVEKKLIDTLDPLQNIIDHNRLSDSRHIIAIKK